MSEESRAGSDVKHVFTAAQREQFQCRQPLGRNLGRVVGPFSDPGLLFVVFRGVF